LKNPERNKMNGKVLILYPISIYKKGSGKNSKIGKNLLTKKARGRRIIENVCIKCGV
jgi:hypothetical protein